MNGDTMTVVFVYKNCSTCRKALKWLHHSDIDFEERDLVTLPPSKKDLKGILALVEKHGGSFKELFNTSGQVYREMGLSKKIKEGMTVTKAFDLLSSNGMLVKRPLVWTDSRVVLGFKEDEFAEALGSQKN